MGKSQRGTVDGMALGKAAGMVWAAGVVGLGVMARAGWGEEWRDLLADAYLGYDSTRDGLAIGAVWGFLDAFIGAYLLAWLYNRFR